MSDQELRKQRSKRFKVRKTWQRNPVTQVIPNKKRIENMEPEHKQIQKGLEEFYDQNEQRDDS